MPKYDHVAYQVSDMDAAIDFYVGKLGFTLSSRTVNELENEQFAYVTLDDLRLELLQDLSGALFDRPEIKPPYCPHIAIQVDDMDQAVACLKAQQIPIIRGPLAIPDQVTWLYFADPDNNVLEYVHWYKKE